MENIDTHTNTVTWQNMKCPSVYFEVLHRFMLNLRWAPLDVLPIVLGEPYKLHLCEVSMQDIIDVACVYTTISYSKCKNVKFFFYA